MEIAKACGLSKAGLIYYYPFKLDLFVAVIDKYVFGMHAVLPEQFGNPFFDIRIVDANLHHQVVVIELENALRVFAKMNYEKASQMEIAKACGLSKAGFITLRPSTM